MAGLCESCRHVRVVKAKHGARFYLCRLSATDPLFAKYPRIPVLRCSGYEAGANAGATAEAAGGSGSPGDMPRC